jgi:hypothetical protein
MYQKNEMLVMRHLLLFEMLSLLSVSISHTFSLHYTRVLYLKAFSLLQYKYFQELITPMLEQYLEAVLTWAVNQMQIKKKVELFLCLSN